MHEWQDMPQVLGVQADRNSNMTRVILLFLSRSKFQTTGFSREFLKQDENTTL